MNTTSRFSPPFDCVTNPAILGRMAQNHRSPASPQVALRVAAVYDDSAAGQRVLNVLDRLESASAGIIRVRPVLWRFDRLALIFDRCRAADDLADADVIVLSLSGRDAMPARIETWFNYCLDQKRGTTTLLVLQRDEEAWVVAESKPVPARADRRTISNAA